MKATNQKNIRQNNNSRGLGLLACMVLACMGMGSNAAYGGWWGDTCIGAFPWGGGLPIQGDGSWSIYNSQMTLSHPQNMPCVTDPAQSDVWIRWTAAFTGPVTASACNFPQDIYLAVSNPGADNAWFCDTDPLSGRGPETWLACNDDADACGTGGSSITWQAKAGLNYLLRLGFKTVGNASGTLVISTDRTGACCTANDSCLNGVGESVCAEDGGTFMGIGSTCDSSICLPVSNAFTYQGKLMDNGVPINGTADLMFWLLDAATGGNSVGMPSWGLNVSVVDGLFTVTVNEQDEFGPNAFIGAARWLEIRVRVPAGSGNYTALTPRQAITAAPFSKL